MFKVAAVRKVMWPCLIHIPKDGGSVQKAQCDLEFEILPQDEHDEFIAARGDLLARTLIGWSGVMQEDGKTPLEFNEETKASFLRISYARVAALKSYYEAASGARAERKN